MRSRREEQKVRPLSAEESVILTFSMFTVDPELFWGNHDAWCYNWNICQEVLVEEKNKVQQRVI